MSPERWQKVRAVFDKAVACAPSQTDDVLREACGEDTVLYEEVRRMLAEHERSSPLDRAVWENASLGVFPAGSTVGGRYRIVRYLNRGGMGEVYEAQDLELGERVALKTLLPEVAADARMIARFKQEIQLSRKIGHPNVCRVFDLARHPADGSSPDAVFFLTMEFLAGETLAARLEREGRMTLPEALPLLDQVAQALDAAHRVGVIHRDLKPSNVMLTDGSGSMPARAVVTDFGLARSHAPEKESTASLSGRIMGTLDYMAPELLAGAQATFASDIYALGMVAYKMVTGALPFASDTPLAGAILRSKEPIPSPKAFVAGLDPKWERAILRALDKNPARRFATAAEFIGALRGDSTSIRLALPEMNRRKWAAATCAVVLAAGAWFGWKAWAGAKQRPSPEALMLYSKGVDDIGAGAYFAATKALEESVKQAPHFALAHARLAEAWVELEMPEKAQEQMLLARRENISELPQKDRLQIEAIDLTITREFAAAAAKYEQMAKLAGGNNAESAVDLGRAYENAGKPDKAIEAYRRAAERLTHNPAAWLRLGVLYSRQSNAAKADEAFAQAERLYQLTSNLEGLTELQFQQGIAANRRSQWAQGATFLKRALDIAQTARDVEKEVRIKLQLAANAYRTGDAATSEQLSTEALTTAESEQVESLAVVGLIVLGNAHTLKADLSGAEKYYHQALSLARRSASPHLTAVSLLSLAALHEQRKQPDDAMQEAEEARKFFGPNHFSQESFLCLTIVSRSEEAKGNYQAQLGSARALLEAANRLADRGRTATAHESVALALSNLDRYPEALEEFQGFAAMSSDISQVGYSAMELGETYCILGRFDEAGAALAKADSAAEKNPILRERIAEVRAEIALRQGRFTDSEALTRKALKEDPKDDHRGPVELSRILAASLMGQGRNQEGLTACRTGMSLLAGQSRPRTMLRVQLVLAQALLATGNRSEALKVLQEMESRVDQHPEMRWQVLAWIEQVGGQKDERVQEALDSLARLWGPEAFGRYLQRYDVRRLSRPFLKSVSAKS